MASQLKQLRKVCLSFPDAHEVESWGAPTFRFDNHLFAMYAEANNNHGDGREGVWIKCTPINQSLMISANPKRFFFPPYVGPSGWIGVYLDGRVNWKELASILQDGYEMTAAKYKGKGRTKERTKPRTKNRTKQRTQTRSKRRA